MNIKIKIITLMPFLLALVIGPLGLTKLVLNLIIFFNIRGKMSIIRCDKLLVLIKIYIRRGCY